MWCQSACLPISRSIWASHVLTFSRSHVRDFALFWDYRLAKTRIPSPEFRIPLAAQIGVSPKKYIVDHTLGEKSQITYPFGEVIAVGGLVGKLEGWRVGGLSF